MHQRMFKDGARGSAGLRNRLRRLVCPFLLRAARTAAQLRRDRRAVAALEFALVGPVYLLFLFAAFGVGLVGFYQLALDDAVRDAARQIQIDGPAARSKSDFVNAVCQTFGLLASDCTATLTYNVQATKATDGFAGFTPATLPASGAFVIHFFDSGTSYAGGVNVLVQVAYPLPFTLPYIGALVTTTGTNSVVSTATVRVEPYG